MGRARAYAFCCLLQDARLSGFKHAKAPNLRSTIWTKRAHSRYVPTTTAGLRAGLGVEDGLGARRREWLSPPHPTPHPPTPTPPLSPPPLPTPLSLPGPTHILSSFVFLFGQGATAPIVVRFADTDKQRQQRRIQQQMHQQQTQHQQQGYGGLLQAMYSNQVRAGRGAECLWLPAFATSRLLTRVRPPARGLHA